MEKLYKRWQKRSVEQALNTRRVVLIEGPRQCGKTTLAKQLVSDERAYLTLDTLALREAAESDPEGFVTHKFKTLIIDEIQRVPSLLIAIKKEVDENTRPGQYILTGSANIRTLPSVQESLAGRIRKVRLRPLSQGEIIGTQPSFLSYAFQKDLDYKWTFYDRETLLKMAFRGGFPETLLFNDREKKEWHRDYLSALLERDLQDITKIHNFDAMQELIRVLAAWSSKFMDISSIASGLSIQRPTVKAYINALQALYLVEKVPAWAKTDYARIGKQSKVFMGDSGLMSSILSWDLEQIQFDADRTGKLLETFIFNELASQIDASEEDYTLYHYRDREKREIDFLIERGDKAILGIEVKASSTVFASDFKHLRWFQENLMTSKTFSGLVLYSGKNLLSFGPNLWAVPTSMLWPSSS